MEKIKKFVELFTDKFDYDYVHKIGKNYFMINKNLEEVESKITHDVFSIGIILGRDDEKFLPSSALIDMISKTSERKMVVNKKAEWLFLCGRDVLEEGIVSGRFKGLVLVMNEQGENLGYGKIVEKKGKKIIKNILDKGSYLRIER